MPSARNGLTRSDLLSFFGMGTGFLSICMIKRKKMKKI